jgi:hypothetical protein
MNATPISPPRERPLTGLVSDLWRQASRLARAEAELAKAEISEKVSDMGSGLASLAAGGAVVLAGFIVLLFAAVGGLQMWLDTPHAIWLAPLIVGVITMIIGYIAVSVGRRNLSASHLKPERTVDSVRRDAQFMKEHVR